MRTHEKTSSNYQLKRSSSVDVFHCNGALHRKQCCLSRLLKDNGEYLYVKKTIDISKGTPEFGTLDHD